MKRTVSIFLILIHLLNIIGFYGIFARMEFLHNVRLAAQLDDDRYSGSEAITLKLPYALPYSNFSDSYERVEGKLNHDGEIYRLVKQKIINDTIYVVCVKDKKAAWFENAYAELAFSFTDKGADTKSNSKACAMMIKDFEFSNPIEIRLQPVLQAITARTEYADLYARELAIGVDHPPKI